MDIQLTQGTELLARYGECFSGLKKFDVSCGDSIQSLGVGAGVCSMWAVEQVPI
jgi:hypothetical protein